MRHMRYDAMPSEDEIAAALAAVRCYIDVTAPMQVAAPPARPWHTAAALEAQGVPPTRNGSNRAWSSVDRAARAGRWSSGIIGL
jgi:hypothetical protein